MTHPDTTATLSPVARALAALRALNALCDRLSWSLPALLARLVPASVFWASARTKVDGFEIADSTYWLFENEYALPLLPSALAAVLATLAEHVFSVTLAVGLATRVSAAALLAMTAVIQIFVYPGAWATHGLWAACFLALVARGPGAVSLDRVLGIDR